MSIDWRYLGALLIGGALMEACNHAGLYLLPTVGRILGLIERRPSLQMTSSTARVIFFPEENVPCRQHYELYHPDADDNVPRCRLGYECQFSHAAPLLEDLFRLLYATKSCLDVCVYMITSYELCSVILALHARRISIRVIVDGNFCDDSKSKVGRFRAQGIPIRSNIPGYLMHHKFLIVDKKLLLNGSFNWTGQAITSNMENVMIVDDPGLVKPFVNEFDRMWKEFDIGRK